MKFVLIIFTVTSWLNVTSQNIKLTDTTSLKNKIIIGFQEAEKIINQDLRQFDYINPKFLRLLIDSLNFNEIKRITDTSRADKIFITYTTLDFNENVESYYQFYYLQNDSYKLAGTYDPNYSEFKSIPFVSIDTISNLIISKPLKKYRRSRGACTSIHSRTTVRNSFIKEFFGQYQLILELKANKLDYYFKPHPSFKYKIDLDYYTTGKF